MNESVRTTIVIGGVEVVVEVSNSGINFIDEDGKVEYQRLDILENLIKRKGK